MIWIVIQPVICCRGVETASVSDNVKSRVFRGLAYLTLSKLTFSKNANVANQCYLTLLN